MEVRTINFVSAGERSSFTRTSLVAGAGSPAQEFKSNGDVSKFAGFSKSISLKTRKAEWLFSKRVWIL